MKEGPLPYSELSICSRTTTFSPEPVPWHFLQQIMCVWCSSTGNWLTYNLLLIWTFILYIYSALVFLAREQEYFTLFFSSKFRNIFIKYFYNHSSTHFFLKLTSFSFFILFPHPWSPQTCTQTLYLLLDSVWNVKGFLEEKSYVN